MKKLIHYLLTSAVVVLALVLSLLFFVQSKWAKDKIGRVLEEIALQQGIELKIGTIEGELPLKWALTNIHLELNTTDSIDVDLLRLRLAFFPLLRGEIGISYLGADKIFYQFTPREGEMKITSFSQPLFVRFLKIKEFHAINSSTHQEGVYSIGGHCRFKKNLRSFDLYAKAQSSTLELELFVQGHQKSNQISTSLSLDVKSNAAFAPFSSQATVPLTLETKCTGPWKTWENLLTSSLPVSKPIQGEFSLKIPSQAAHITSQFSLFSDRALAITSFHLKSPNLTAFGNATFNPQLFPTSLEGAFQIPELSHFFPSLHGSAQGKIDFSENNCQILLSSDTISSPPATFTTAHLEINAEHQQNLWTGTMKWEATHPDLGVQGSADLRFRYPRLELQAISLQGKQISLHGDIAADLPHFEHLQGGITFQLDDLTPFTEIASLPLAGHMGGTIDFQNENIQCHAIGKGVKAGAFLSDEMSLDLFATDLFNHIKGKLAIETHHAYLADIFLDSASYAMEGSPSDWNYQLSAQGSWKHPFSITTNGHFSLLSENFQFTCDHLAGNLLEKNITLEEPFQLSLKNHKLMLTNFKMNIADGFFQSALQVTPEASRLFVKAQHFPLDFLTLLSPRLSLQGLASLDIDFAGTSSDLVGHANVLLEHADIFPAGSTTPIQTKASLQANLNHDTLQIHSYTVATDQQFVDLSLTLPLSYELSPLRISIHPHKTLAGQCTIEGHVNQLFDFINIGSQRFGGFLSCRLVLSGSIEKPSLFGPISVQGGFYTNDFIGLSLKGGDVQASAEGTTLTATSIHVQDTASGSATATAQFLLQPRLPFTIQGTIDRFQVIQLDWLAGSCSGPFTISGNLDKGLVTGTVAIDKANIHIPDQLPSEIPSLPVTFIHQPPSSPSPIPKASYPFHYDIHIHGKQGTLLSGRGLEAELGGDLHLTGKNLEVLTVGTLHTIKGNFSFAGKDFKMTHGEIIFSENGSFINIAANHEMPDLNVTVLFRGSLRDPQLIFQSNPPLPISTLLARILFNKEVSELSASQIVQLASTIMTLSSSSTPDILGTIRRNLGVDRLSISATEEGGFSLEIGKSLSTEIVKGVAATLTQDTENSHIKVEVELKGGFILQAETQEDDQGKFSFKWNKNY